MEKTSVLSNDALRARWWHREALMEETHKRTGDTILLAFSRGKDSIAAWLALRDSKLFKRIIPVYLYLVPGLKFEEESLKYFEDVIIPDDVQQRVSAAGKALEEFRFFQISANGLSRSEPGCQACFETAGKNIAGQRRSRL